MKKIRLLSAILAIGALSGCSTYSANRYSSNVDNIIALRAFNGKTVNVGSFTSSKPGESEIMCRGVGPIKTPDGEPFADFVRKALVDEMRLAGTFSSSSPVTLTGNLDNIDFSSTGGTWNLALTVKSSTGKTLTVYEQYSFKSSFVGETACNQTAQALMPAVQNLVGKIVRSPDFRTFLD